MIMRFLLSSSDLPAHPPHPPRTHSFVCLFVVVFPPLRLPMCPPAGHPPSGTPLPFRELALFLHPCVSRHQGNKKVEDREGEEGVQSNTEDV